MLRRCFFLLIFAILLAANASAGIIAVPDELEDLAVREALFSAFQGEWFDAITRVDNELMQRNKPDAGELDPTSKHSDQATAIHIDFELAYRMHLRDGQTILSIIESIVDDKTRNELLFKLAKLFFYKGQSENALLTLDRTSGEIAPTMTDDITFFRGQVLIANGRYSDATSILDDLIKAQSFLGFAGYNRKAQNMLGFAGYNLGISHLLSGNKVEGRRQLDLAGQITSSDDEMTLSIRDKANLVLAEQLLSDGLYDQAGMVIDRVRLEGPFSVQALLSAGWVSASQERYKQALVPWTLLSERDVTNTAVQEAMIAVPYCYGQLGIYSKAAVLYNRAVEAFGIEIDKLTDSIASIREGRFLKTLVRRELKQDSNWVVKLRELPEMPETFYLLDLMASIEFQEALNNYSDLDQLHKKLTRWLPDLHAYEEMVAKRRSYYSPLLPFIDTEFKKLDSRMRQHLKQRDVIELQLKAMKSAPRPDLFATAEEKSIRKEIDRVDRSLRPYRSIKIKNRIDRLRGLVNWPIYASYDQRLMSTSLNFRRLDEVVINLKKQHDSFVRIRRAATQSYRGYDKIFNALRIRIKNVLENTVSVKARQGQLLEVLAEAELVKRREKIKAMQIKARFAMADSFDRASKSLGTERGVR